MTVDQIAKELNVSRNTVIKLIKEGKLQAIKVGDRYRIKENNFDQFITASEVRLDNLVGGTEKL